jgi:hypothetical protein
MTLMRKVSTLFALLLTSAVAAHAADAPTPAKLHLAVGLLSSKVGVAQLKSVPVEG